MSPGFVQRRIPVISPGMGSGGLVVPDSSGSDNKPPKDSVWLDELNPVAVILAAFRIDLASVPDDSSNHEGPAIKGDMQANASSKPARHIRRDVQAKRTDIANRDEMAHR